ncbi:MAG: 23S rRNA (uracil(1939)-C(5))-methyltransferase RlmD [Treponema sp.]|nr:23S rRNA (uracil(1939)-C(5))-methyltransferase RlmD [Treponema sp.]
MEIVTVNTEKIVFGGNSIGKIDSKTVFIPYSLPGETLSVNIVQHKNDYDNAEIIKIFSPSPFRVKPECKYYGICGGCNMMHISPKEQKNLRKQMLYDAFSNNKIILEKDFIQIVSGPDYNYRARFQLNDGGLSEKNGNTIIPVDECLCAEKVVNDYLNQNSMENRPKGRAHIFGSEKVVLTSEKNVQNATTASFENQFPQLKIATPAIEKSQSPYKTQNNDKKSNKRKLKIKENHYFAGTIVNPENTVTVKLLDKNISFDVRGFFQSNLFVFEKVLQLILDNLPGGKSILDMYSGCGSISAFLTDKYDEVSLVEHNRDALVFAEQNLAGKKHISYGLSGANFVKNCAQFCNFDACVVDPPRSGMEKEVCDYLCKSKIPYICSLSCDPSTHARDCSKLIKAGYSLEKLFLLDFYPNTSHIESLAIFKLQI